MNAKQVPGSKPQMAPIPTPQMASTGAKGTASTKGAKLKTKAVALPEVKPIKIMQKADIEKAILSISRRGALLDRDIQAAAVSTLDHIDKHGDDSLFNRLYQAMPKGVRKNALAGWALYFGKLRIATADEVKADKKEHKPLREFRYEKTASSDVQASMLVLWHTFKHSDKPVIEMFDVQAAINHAVHAIIAKADKLEQQGVKVEHKEMILKLAALVDDKPTTTTAPALPASV